LLGLKSLKVKEGKSKRQKLKIENGEWKIEEFKAQRSKFKVRKAAPSHHLSPITCSLSPIAHQPKSSFAETRSPET
jgi:hypothetical protein